MDAISRKYRIIFLTFDDWIFHKIPTELVVPRKIVYQIAIAVKVIKYSFLPQQTVPIARGISPPCYYEVSVNQLSAVQNLIFQQKICIFHVFHC